MSKDKSFKEFFLPIIVLVSICVAVGATLAFINGLLTRSDTEDSEMQKEQEALSLVIPDNDGFTKQEISSLPESVVALYTDNGSDAIAVLLSIKGYNSSDPMSVAVGFDENGNITKISVISCSGETKGIGSKVSNEEFLSLFVGKNNVDGVDTISGATVSSSAFKAAVADACDLVASFRATEVAE